MEAREADGIAREQALQVTVQNLTTQLTIAQQQAGGAVPVGGTLATGTGTVDTRALGKPEVFEGNEAKRHDFRVVFKAYCSCVNQRLRALMSGVEANISGSFLNGGLDARDTSCSTQLYYILLLLCRQQPLTLLKLISEFLALRVAVASQYGSCMKATPPFWIGVVSKELPPLAVTNQYGFCMMG
eukprot:4057157-Amphidinium_carterae.4